MSEFIRNMSPSGWAPVSRRAMDDKRLSLSTRGAFGWLCTRPDDHQIFLPYAMKRWGITKPTWRRIRTELEMFGYLRVRKVLEGGRFKWIYELTDILPVEKAMDKIPGDSKTTGSEPDDIHETGLPDPSLPETSIYHAATPRASKAGVILNAQEEAQFQKLLAQSSFEAWSQDGHSDYWVTRQKNVLRRRFKNREDIVQIIDFVVDYGYRSFEGEYL